MPNIYGSNEIKFNYISKKPTYEKLLYHEEILIFQEEEPMPKKKGEIIDIQREQIIKMEKELADLRNLLKAANDTKLFFKKKMTQVEAQLLKSKETNASINKRLGVLQKALSIRFEIVDIDVPGKLIWIKLRGTNDGQIPNLQSCFNGLFDNVGLVVTDETVESIREFSEEEIKELIKFLPKSEEKKC